MTENDDSGSRSRSPGIDEAFAQLRDTGRATWGAGGDTLKALRRLIAADAALARSALGRAFALAGMAIALGASCWLLLMGALVTGVAQILGVSMPVALLLCALLSAAITGWAIWRAIGYFEHTRMQATRRQLAQLGIGELADFGSAASAGKPGESAASGHGDESSNLATNERTH